MDQIIDAREAKLKYGELLREQMRFDAEKKKLEKLESTKIPKIENVLNFTNNQKDHNRMAYAQIPHAQPAIDKKQLLQKQMEAGDFFPFGKRRTHQQIKITKAPPTLQLNSPTYQANQLLLFQQQPIPSSMAIPNNSYLLPQNYYRQVSYPIQQNSMRANYHSGQNGYLQLNSNLLQNNSMNFSPPKQTPISMPSSSNAIPYHATHEDSPNKKRNLLKYENITQAQLVKEQLEKQKLQQFLKIQMQQAALRKQQQKLKILMENQKLEQDHKRYEQQKLRKQNQEMMEKKRRQEENRQKQEEYKRSLEKAQEEAINSRKKNNVKPNNANIQRVETIVSFKDHAINNTIPQKTQVKKQQTSTQQKYSLKKNPYAELSVYSDQKESHYYTQARLKNQADRKNQQKYVQMIKKDVDNIRNEIISQSQMYKIEMEKIKIDADKVRFQKEKLDYQFLRLKDEYDREKSNQKLKYALDKTNDYYEQQKLKRKKDRVHTQKNYSTTVHEKKASNRVVTERSYDDGIKSLTGDSVKIPMPKDYLIKKHSIQYNSIPYEQLHESQINHNYHSQYLPKDNYDSLDSFVKNQHINNAKWNTLSSVDSEVTRQIQHFLQEQRAPIQYQQQRDYYNPQSNISSVGKMLLRNRPYNADTLNTLGMSWRYSDYGKINSNNNERLKKHKNAENEDGDLDRLDNLLNNY